MPLIPATREAETGRFLSLRPAWSIESSRTASQGYTQRTCLNKTKQNKTKQNTTTTTNNKAQPLCSVLSGKKPKKAIKDTWGYIKSSQRHWRGDSWLMRDRFQHQDNNKSNGLKHIVSIFNFPHLGCRYLRVLVWHAWGPRLNPRTEKNKNKNKKQKTCACNNT
jgi:hypothetical protein